MELFLSKKIKIKLKDKHNFSEDEIEDSLIQCFANISGGFLIDNREEHQTNPPTHWFISETDKGVQLKVVFIQEAIGDIYIKTAYTPSTKEKEIYQKHAC